MNRLLLVAILILLSAQTFAQTFEILPLQDTYKGTIGETVKAPIKFKNTSEKPIVLVIRKLNEQIGSTQKNFLCLDANCLEQKPDEFVVKVEPGQTLNNIEIALEAGLVPGFSAVRYIVFNKFNPAHQIEFDINYAIEEKMAKQNIYNSKFITLHDVYPNPSIDHAYVDYKLVDDHVKATIRVHNILGNIVGEYDLSSAENLMRIKTDELNAGIYFYTLYLDNESVMTRKLIVKK